MIILGYAFTAVYVALLVWLFASIYLSRRRIAASFRGRISQTTLLIALAVIAFFVLFSIKYVNPAEQLYFDENIYQGMALNILGHGNALWCQYGTAHLSSCGANLIYHDPAEMSFYLAIAFGIFGIGTATAYGFELAVGALSIFLVFLLASLMFGRRSAVASAVVFALIPELFIWSRTQAVPNLTLMAFTVLAFLAYEVYRNARSWKTMGFFLAALGMAVYVRIEAGLLIPIFVVMELPLILHYARRAKQALGSSRAVYIAAVIVAFAILIMPDIYYVSYEASSLNYGSGALCGSSSTSTFSLSNFMCNIKANTGFFLGAYNSAGYYPAYFAPLTTIIAIVGVVLMLLFGRREDRHYAVALGLWVLVLHAFYDAFYAGSVTYGVDVRFMLVIYPAIAIFAGYAIARISEELPKLSFGLQKLRNAWMRGIVASIALALLLLAFAVFPFYNALGTITLPTSQMPQEHLPMAATNFIYGNASAVPSNCLVFSFTPDIWYEYNRSAAQIGYLGSTNSSFTAFESGFSCFVLDYGYWCNVSPYNSGECPGYLTTYNLTTLASTNVSGSNFALYRMSNYRP